MGHRITDNDSSIKRLLKDSKKMRGAHVRVGYPAGAAVAPPQKGGSKHKPVVALSEIATIAVTHEKGSISKNIPPRPTIGPTIDNKQKKILKLKRKLANEILSGRMSPDAAMNILGVFLEKEIKRAITLLRTPPLAPETIKRKKSTNPLIDRNQMRGSVTYTVHYGK